MSDELKEFNVNHRVRLRLTEAGLRILREEHDDLYARSTCPPEFKPPEADQHGWVELQAWEVMRSFGPHMGNGSPVPFETTILIRAEDLKPAP